MAGVGSKRFILKPFKPSPTMDQHAAVEVFAKLQQAILKIYVQEQSQLSYEELYRFAYQMVLHKHGEILYAGVSETVRHHLGKMAGVVRQAPDDALLARLEESWQTHVREMRMVRDILMYMDRTFVPTSRKLLSYDNGTLLFREVVARDPAIRQRTQRLLLAAVADGREGKPFDSALLRGVLGMLVELGITSTSVYAEDFESPLLEEEAGHYRQETAAYMAAHSCPEYLRHVEARLAGEMARAREIVHASTIPKLEAVLHRVLVGEHASALLDKEGSGLVTLLERDAIDDLGRMYRLFSLHRGAIVWKDKSGVSRTMSPVAALRDSMKGHLVDIGKAVVTDQELLKDPPAYIRRLIELRSKYMRLVDRAFSGDKDFARAVKEGFELVLNAPGDRRPPEYLSLFLDEHFRSGFKGLTDAQVEETLSHAIAVFRFLSNKDEFEEWYKTHLQKRLLGNKVGSDDAERIMIGKLKSECGVSFTSKLEGMFTDLRTSAEFMDRYRRERPLPSGAGASSAAHGRVVDLDVTVLTMNNWPAAKVQPCRLPPEVQVVADSFTSYYLSSHSGRRLRWHTEKGTAEVTFCPAPGRRHELTVSTYQMAVLVMFNSADRVPFTRMVEAVGVAPEELSRHVLSLLNPKVAILKKVGQAGAGASSSSAAGGSASSASSSAPRDLEAGDVLMVNSEFTSKMLRIKVPLISQKSAQAAAAAVAGAGGPRAGGEDEGADVASQVEAQRKTMLDAAIVRIMKARKTLDHANLVAEVTRQLSSRFVPQPSDVKKRIEDLIEREYLERDAGDKRLYSYVAS